MSTQVEKKKEKPQAVAVIQSSDFMSKVQNILPKMIKPQHFVRVALHALSTTPKLLQCTPASLCNSLMELARTGLEPDGRHAHLLPYADRKSNVTRCQLIVDWKGMVELARRSGQCAMWKADIIFENDDFEINKGEVTRHVIDYRNSNKRGEPLLVYSYFKYKDGTEDYEIMDMAECEAIRKRSKAGNSGPWQTDRNEMLKKTVMRRHSKRLPQSPEMQAAIDLDWDAPDFDMASAEKHARENIIKPIDPEESESHVVESDPEPDSEPENEGVDDKGDAFEDDLPFPDSENSAQDGAESDETPEPIPEPTPSKKVSQKKGFKLESDEE